MRHITQYKGLATGAIIIGAGCLTVSMFQATLLVIDNISDQRMKLLIVLGVGCALMTSQWLVRALIPLVRSQKGFLWAVAIAASLATIAVVETFSISSSSVTFDGGLVSASRKENLNSPERAQIQMQVDELTADIASTKAQIEKLRATKNNASASHTSNRADITKDISRLDYKIKQLREERIQKIDDMNAVNVSVIDSTFKSLEQTTGISQSNIGLIFGILMTICAMTPNLVMGALSSSRRNDEEVLPVKKSQRPNLKSVRTNQEAAHAI